MVDSGNMRVQKFDSNGTFLAKWGSYGSGDGQFSDVTHIAIDMEGNVYAVEKDVNRIQKFALTPPQPGKDDKIGLPR